MRAYTPKIRRIGSSFISWAQLSLLALLIAMIRPAPAQGSDSGSYSPYSAMSCPMYGGYGGYGGGSGYGYGGGGGYGGYPRVCGAPSFFHYYVCCDYNPGDCCVVLETWVVVMLVIIGVLTLGCCLACCGACVWGYQRSRDN